VAESAAMEFFSSDELELQEPKYNAIKTIVEITSVRFFIIKI
jgi:hypothetical protein